MAVQAVSSPLASSPRERYIVRTIDGKGCGHHHRSVIGAVQCMLSSHKGDQRHNRPHSQRSVWRYTGRVSERLPISL